MTDEPDNLILEHLRHICDGVDDPRIDVREVKTRPTLVESQLTIVGDRIDGLSERMDRAEARLERIETRA